MKVAFLCGGIGKRMLPLTEDKFLIKFVGKTLLEHQIEAAVKAGLNEFIFIGNPQNSDRIREITSGLSGISYDFAVQPQPLGIADALQCARHLLNGQTLIVNPNDLLDGAAYTALLRAAGETAAACHILGYKTREYFPGGYLLVDDAANLKHIVEKPERGSEPSDMVNILAHLHADPLRLLEYAGGVRTTRDDTYECALDRMAKDGHVVRVVPYDGFWAPIKYPWHILAVVRRILEQSRGYVSPSARVSERAHVEGGVIVGDNVRILENAVVRGPAYIGPNSVVGNSSLVREYTNIGLGCVVGYSTEIKASYIGDNCWFHTNYIGDSVVGDDCSFGAGTVLSNWRFDGRNIRVRVGQEIVDTGLSKLGAMIGNNCRTGVNVSVMPGSRIGPNSVVGAHVCLSGDLAPDKSILCESRYRVMDTKVVVGGLRNVEVLENGGGFRCVE